MPHAMPLPIHLHGICSNESKPDVSFRTGCSITGSCSLPLIEMWAALLTPRIEHGLYTRESSTKSMSYEYMHISGCTQLCRRLLVFLSAVCRLYSKEAPFLSLIRSLFLTTRNAVVVYFWQYEIHRLFHARPTS